MEKKNRGAVELSLCAIIAQFLVVLFAPFMGVVPGVTVGAMASTDFVRSVNPISTRGTDYALPSFYLLMSYI